MKRPCAVVTLLAVCLLPASPLLAAIQLAPVVTSGLTHPVFVANAGDGSNRLFIVEQEGFIRVLQPGSSTPTEFLDIHTKISSGGERGLLGLAFHPDYASSGRFFVFYTKVGNGALVIAEYHVTADPDVADPLSEDILLTIPHPDFANHNGGMLAFGPDGYLYVGVGDGGSGNDPSNNGQKKGTLLGKILRLDVSLPGTYSSPPDNPYVNQVGRDEIFAIGFRNPFRFSFDRLTGDQWVGDVGQNAREEVDSPILNGGNYGWRVFEGFDCTGLDPALCTPGNYEPPVFDYAHTAGRCSITGGYVYRGPLGTLPAGTYVYGDFCSGEILSWDGTSQTVLLGTGLNISSFGEDEDGELYVVGLGGSVHRIVSDAACTYSIAPTSATFPQTGGTGTVNVTAPPGCGWTAHSLVSWTTITAGRNGTGNGTVTYSVAPYGGSANSRTGKLKIAGQTLTVTQLR